MGEPRAIAPSTATRPPASSPMIDPDHTVELKIGLARVKVAVGSHQEAIVLLTEALGIAEQHNLRERIEQIGKQLERISVELQPGSPQMPVHTGGDAVVLTPAPAVPVSPATEQNPGIFSIFAPFTDIAIQIWKQMMAGEKAVEPAGTPDGGAPTEPPRPRRHMRVEDLPPATDPSFQATVEVGTTPSTDLKSEAADYVAGLTTRRRGRLQFSEHSILSLGTGAVAAFLRTVRDAPNMKFVVFTSRENKTAIAEAIRKLLFPATRDARPRVQSETIAHRMWGQIEIVIEPEMRGSDIRVISSQTKMAAIARFYGLL